MQTKTKCVLARQVMQSDGSAEPCYQMGHIKREAKRKIYSDIFDGIIVD